jgi:hypothetical protein
VSLKKAAVMLLFAIVFAVPGALADSGTVLKWESKSYSQSANIIRNRIVYTVKVGDSTYQIAKRSEKVQFTKGQTIECRVNKNHIFVTNGKGKEEKFDIIGTE